MLQEELRSRVADYVNEHGDFGVEMLDGEEVEVARVKEAVSSVPFLATKKLVVLRRFAKNKQCTEKIEDIVNAVNDSVDLVLVEEKPDKRTVWYKYLLKNTETHTYDELNTHSLADWATKYADKLGTQLSKQDAEMLIERVGANQQLLTGELSKLAMATNRITQKDIELHTEKALHSTVFELLEAASNGQLQKAMELYEEQRAQKVDPAAILPLIVWQVHVLAVIATAPADAPNDVASRSGINPYVIRKSQAAARRLGPKKIKNLVSILLEYDVRMKQQSLDADEVVRYVLARMAI